MTSSLFSIQIAEPLLTLRHALRLLGRALKLLPELRAALKDELVRLRDSRMIASML